MVTRLGVTVVEAMEIVQVVTAKSRGGGGALCCQAFMSNCLTISHTCQPYRLSRGVAVGLFEVVVGKEILWLERGWACHIVTLQGEK